jgi:hypothetical protein
MLNLISQATDFQNKLISLINLLNLLRNFPVKKQFILSQLHISKFITSKSQKERRTPFPLLPKHEKVLSSRWQGDI